MMSTIVISIACFINIAICIHATMTVSYTHLDVYKRQLHASYACFLVFTCFLFRSSVTSSVVNMFLLIFGFFIVHRIEDVIWHSYVISMYWPVAMFQRCLLYTSRCV